MNKKNYIDKIELILNTSGKYITRKEKDMILDYVNYFKTKNNVIEDKNIELVIEIERLNNIINELEKTLLEWHEYWEDDDSYSWQYKDAYDYLQDLKGDESNGR